MFDELGTCFGYTVINAEKTVGLRSHLNTRLRRSKLSWRHWGTIEGFE